MIEEGLERHFEAWGVVDLFGHIRLAGRISEQAIGGETFIRVDVPNSDETFHTRLFGKGAIYSMSLTDEPIAREYAKRSGTRPVSAYDVAALVKDAAPAKLSALSVPAADDDDQDDGFPL